jgi:hypothetical protein
MIVPYLGLTKPTKKEELEYRHTNQDACEIKGARAHPDGGEPLQVVLKAGRIWHGSIGLLLPTS